MTTLEHTRAGGWIERSRSCEDGSTIRWLERSKPGKPGVVERRYLTPVERTGPVVGTCEIVEGAGFSAGSSRVRGVVVTKYARAALDREDIDGLFEVGGGAFGWFDRDNGELIIDSLIGGSYDGTESSCLLDIPWIDRMHERELEAGRVLCGTFHLHPGDDAILSPSTPDKVSWRSWAKANDGNPFVGLIVNRWGTIAAFTEHGEQLPVHVEPTDRY